MKNCELIETVYQLDEFMTNVEVEEDTKIRALVKYLSEIVVLDGPKEDWKERLRLLITLIENQTSCYIDMLEQ